MGEKRVSVRTLPGGERVYHYPPDPEHPEGRQVLLRDSSPVRQRLDALRPEHQRRQAELNDAHLARVRVKRARQRHKGLPSEKSPI